MNPNNPLYKYADKLNDYGINLVKKFMHSKQYFDLRSKAYDIDKETEQLNVEYERKFRELHAAKRNIELYEIPNARNEYVRQHIEGYKMHLRPKEPRDHSFETYMRILNEVH